MPPTAAANSESESPVAALQKRVQDALRGGDKLRLSVFRMLLAAAKQKQIDSGNTMDDAAMQALAGKLIKQRRDSAAQFRTAGREELAVREEEEIAILSELLPPPPSAAELESAIDEAIKQSAAASPRDIGKVMAQLKKTLPAADPSAVAAQIKQKLSAQ